MSKDVLTRYIKECLLEVKQTLARVSNMPKKPATRDKTQPLGS
jgi:hypothetical protein